jgi:uncharacterized membrane protein
MALETSIPVRASAGHPVVRRIVLADIKDALARGMDDFRAKPSHLPFLGLIYPLGSLLAVRMVLDEGLLPLVFPVISGGALLGPFVALGLYEISRRREQGLDVRWQNAFDVLRSPARVSIAVLGAVLAAIFAVWLFVAMAIYDATLGGFAPATMGEFLGRILTTPGGWALIVIGNSVGFLFAVAVLAISVVSFPLLLDRNVGVAVAVATSVRAVGANPLPMAVWGLVVAGLLLIGALPLFVGLAVVLPVLGHATWHLYRKVVQP